MKFCPKCGAQVAEGLSFCPNCGSALNAQENVNNQQNNVNNDQVANQNMGGRPNVENKNIAVAVILSFVTCGIYGIIWFINMVNDVNNVCKDEHSNQSGGVVFLLTLVTCGIYGIYWFYQAGKRLAVAGSKYGVQISDNSVLYLVLALFGLQIVDYCLVQADLNKFSVQ